MATRLTIREIIRRIEAAGGKKVTKEMKESEFYKIAIGQIKQSERSVPEETHKAE